MFPVALLIEYKKVRNDALKLGELSFTKITLRLGHHKTTVSVYRAKTLRERYL